MDRDDPVRGEEIDETAAGSIATASTPDSTCTNATESTATIAATSSESAASVGETGADERGPLPNTLTIIGQGTPTSVDVTVDGAIEPMDEESVPGVFSGTSVECTVETGTYQYRFAGDLTDVTFVDRVITGPTPASLPNVHVEYEAPDRPGWLFDWQ